MVLRLSTFKGVTRGRKKRLHELFFIVTAYRSYESFRFES